MCDDLPNVGGRSQVAKFSLCGVLADGARDRVLSAVEGGAGVSWMVSIETGTFGAGLISLGG